MKADWQLLSHTSSTAEHYASLSQISLNVNCVLRLFGGRAECWGLSGRRPGPLCVDDFTSHILCCADCFNLPWRGEEPEFLLPLNYHTHMLTHMCMCLHTHTHGFFSSHAYLDILLVFMIPGCRKEFSLHIDQCVWGWTVEHQKQGAFACYTFCDGSCVNVTSCVCVPLCRPLSIS